jgi:potassium efflux system protein
MAEGIGFGIGGQLMDLGWIAVFWVALGVTAGQAGEKGAQVGVEAGSAAASQPTTEATSQPTTAPTSGPAEHLEASAGRREEIQTKIQQVEAATNLDAAAKKSLLEVYTKALDQWRLAESWEAKADEYLRGREAGPSDLAAARERLKTLQDRPTSGPATTIPAASTSEALAKGLADAQTMLRKRQQEAGRLEEEAKQRADRRIAIPGLLADMNQRLEEVKKRLSAPVSAGVSPEMAEGQRQLALGERAALGAEIKTTEEELRFYDGRSEVLSALRDEAKLSAAEAERVVGQWQEEVNVQRRAKAEAQQRMAREEVSSVPEPVRAYAEANAALAKERSDLAKRLQLLAEESKSADQVLDELQQGLEELREKVKMPGMADYFGPLLRDKQSKLPDVRDYRRKGAARQAEISKTHVRILELEELRGTLTDMDSSVNEAVGTLLNDFSQADQEALSRAVRPLLESRRLVAGDLLNDYEKSLTMLIALNFSDGQVLARTEEFHQFLKEYMLWIRSEEPIFRARWPKDPAGEAQLWGKMGKGLIGNVGAQPFSYAAAGAAGWGLWWLRRRFRKAMVTITGRVSKAATDSFSETIRALICTGMACLFWPAAIWFFGNRVVASAVVSEEAWFELALAVANGANVAAAMTLAILFVAEMCKEKGLGNGHFRWLPGTTRFLRKEILRFYPILVICGFLVFTAENHPDSAWRNSVGRVVFGVWMLSVSLLQHRLFHPTGGMFAGRYQRKPSGWLYKLRYVMYVGFVILPVLLMMTAMSGYYYTAMQFRIRFGMLALIGFGVLLFYELIGRWVFVVQRKLALSEAIKKREAAESEKEEDRGEGVKVDEAALNLVAIGDQAKRLIRSLVAMGLILGVWFTWRDMFPAFRFLDRVVLWRVPIPEGITEGGLTHLPVTLASVLLAIIIGTVTVAAAKNIPGVLEMTVLQWLPLDAGGRYAATTIARYIIIVVGLTTGFGAIRIGWSQVQWMAAAVTVGLGFGLQEIFANFVSGLILLFERPIRVGDFVTVGTTEGVVTRIQMRATTITDWDRKELVVPNKEFITGQLINWTLSDPITRVVIPVGIAYGSDTNLARDLLLKAAKSCSYVLEEPPPSAIFLGFGASSLDFELRVFIVSRNHWANMIHEIHTAVDQAFREAKIEIAFPQRDIHVRSISGQWPIVEKGDASPAGGPGE